MRSLYRRLSLLLLAGALIAGGAAADQVITMQSHADAVTVMGQKSPAKDYTQTYWFGNDRMRVDDDENSTIMRLDQKKLYLLDHAQKTFSAIDLPVDFKKLVDPEMAGMMEQMMQMMAPSVTVTATGQSGSFAGYACDYYDVAVKVAMMQINTTGCYSDKILTHTARYQALAEAQAELVPNASWMKDLAQKIKGFPVRTETTTAMGKKSFKNWQELKSVEERTAPEGLYAPPAGYREVKFDPMAQGR